MFETLQEVEGQVNPEETFDHIVKVLLDLVVGGRERRIKHGGDTRVGHKQDDEHVEDGLPFTVGVNDDLLLASLPLLFRLDVSRYLVVTRRPILIVVRVRAVEYF